VKKDKLHTELRYNQIPFEFHQATSKAIMDNKDINSQDYEKEMDRVSSHGTEAFNSDDKKIRHTWFKAMEELARKLRPTYVALRKAGYSDYDLTC
jgi:hypothetical protein